MRAAPRAVEASDVQTLLPYPHDLFGGLTDLNGIIPGQRVGEGRGRARAAHTHGHAHARALLRLVPANISATPEGSDGNSKCRDPHRSVRARGHTHTRHTRTRGAKARPRKVKRFALFRRQRGSDTGEYRLRPYGARGRGVAAGAAAARTASDVPLESEMTARALMTVSALRKK